MSRAFALLLAIFLAGCSSKEGRSVEITDRGLAELSQQHYEGALADFESALAIDPANQTARYQIGVVYRLQQKWRQAARAFADALAHKPDDPALARELEAAQAEVRRLDDEASRAAAEQMRKAVAPPEAPLAPPERLTKDLAEELRAAGHREAVSRARANPVVTEGASQVRGTLDKEVIRRVIRRHLNEVKFCYEKELLNNPDLEGRVMVQFTVAGDGQVVAAVVQSSTMSSPGVEQCIVGAVHRWVFPAPQGGGIVIVSYPFVLKSSS